MRKLTKEQVDLWLLDSVNAKPLPDALSGEELAYLQKMSSPETRENYKRSRNHLRWILADYLGIEPKQIRFAYGSHGKPAIHFPKTNLNFNLSHTRETTLYALSSAPVGVDIEKIENRKSLDKIAQRYFSKKNFAIFKKAPAKEKPRFFFKIWTASEAYMKGLGESAFMIEKFRDRIEFDKDNPDRFQIDEWKILSLYLKRDFAAALSVKADDPEIRILKF